MTRRTVARRSALLAGAILVSGATGIAVGNLAQADTEPPAAPRSIFDLGEKIEAVDRTGKLAGYIRRSEMQGMVLADDLAVRDFESDEIVGYMTPTGFETVAEYVPGSNVDKVVIDTDPEPVEP